MRKRIVFALNLKNLKIRVSDWILITGMFLSLIPIRLAFIHYVGDNWLGSFGLITAIVTVILILNHKQKLGFFGRALDRFFQKRHRKKKLIMVTQFVISFTILALFVHGVNYAEEGFETEKAEINKHLDTASTDEDLTKAAMQEIKENPEVIIAALITFLYIILFDYEVFSLTMWAVNDFSGGLYMNLATVFLVEELEVMGIFIFYHFYGNKLQKNHE